MRLYIRRKNDKKPFEPVIRITTYYHTGEARCERDSSGTTEQARSDCEGDGADSPTRANVVSEAARPNPAPKKQQLLYQMMQKRAELLPISRANFG